MTMFNGWLTQIVSVFLIFVSFAALTGAKAAPSLTDGSRVLILGDSITQGGEYVTDLEYYLVKAHPGQKLDIVSVGLSSETVSGLSEAAHPFPRPYLHERLWAALDLVKPKIVMACYGMNDGIYHPQSPERMQAFQKGINKLIAESKAAGASVILLTPPPFDPVPVQQSVLPDGAPDYSYLHPYAQYDKVLQDYSAWELTLAGPGVQVIDLHTPLLEYLRDQRAKDPSFRLNNDGIHPLPLGSLLMAETILNALGETPPPGDLSSALAAASATPLYGLVKKQRETLSNGWLSYIGYTRDSVVKSMSITETEQEADALQSQIDHEAQAQAASK